MALTLKYQGRQRERSDNGFTTTMVWTGTQEECEAFAAEAAPGDPGEEGSLDSVRIYQDGGNIWNVERRYTTDQDGNFTNKPNVVYGRKSAQLHGGMLSIPIEQHKNYLTHWNFYLAAAPSVTAVPDWWETATDAVLTTQQAQQYAWIRTPSEAPVDSRGRWRIIQKPTYPGLTSYDVAVYTVTETAQFSSAKKAGYGSSITQGGCASRPSNSYSAMLCRELDAPQMNLGFTGNCRGEEAIARAIAGLNLSALVMDYDYNAPNVEHLRSTHEKFFRIIREAQPNLPIILISGPRDPQWPDSAARRDIVKATYDKAVAAGDKNVYFIDGLSFFDKVPRKYATVDQIHPNDLGMYIMFQRILPVLQQALAK